MANLSNINNILRTSSLGVGINCDAEFSLDIEKASANAILSLNSNGGSGAEYLLYSGTSGEFILNKRYVGDRLTISSGGDATFSGRVGLNGTTPSDFNADADDLIVGGGSGDVGITMYSGSNVGDYGAIYFADGTTGSAEYKGIISYEQNNEIMRFHTNTTEALRLDLSQNATFAGTVTVGTGTVAAANAAADDFVITGPGTTATGMTISNTSDAGTGTIFFGDTTSSSAAGFRYNHNTGDMAISAEDDINFTCDNATFAGNVDLKSNAGNATKHLRIWNEGTAADDDAVLSWTAQASRTYSMGIHRDSGNLVITNADASVASGDIINIDNSGNSTFAGKILVGTGATAAASLNAYTQTVSSNLFSALRVIENSGASSYWDIGATGGSSTLLNFYHNGNTTAKISFTHTGGATFAGIVTTDKTFVAKGQNVSHGTSQIKISQENTTKSQIRFYGADTSTAGILEFTGSSSDGSVGGARVTINADGTTKFHANILVDVINNSANSANIIYRSGTSTLVGGGTTANKLYVLDNGNVGIGVTSPDAKLDVQSSGSWGAYGRGSGGDINVENTNTSVTEGGWISIAGYMGNTANSGFYHMAGITAKKSTTAGDGNYGGDLSFWTTSGGANGEANSGMYQRMTIDSSGDVGIGTTSPGSKLHVKGDFVSIEDPSGGYKMELSADTDPVTIMSDNLTGAAYGQIAFVAGNGSGSNDQERMRITSAGDINILNATATDSKSIGITNAAGTTGWTFGNGVLSNTHQFVIYDNTAGSSRMLIDSSGNVGIGNTSPQTDLHVGPTQTIGSDWTSGFGNSRFFVVGGDNGGASVFQSGNGALAMYIYGNTTSGGAIAFYHSNISTNQSGVGSITTTASATAFNTSSDYRLKQDLKDFNGLNLLNKIKVYDFEWKIDNSRSYGVIAHELDKIIPQAVNGEKDAKEMQVVDYSKLVPVLLKSIQELKEEIQILKTKI
jgi:hypothetical protein